ncbi:hypothetical protein M9Y10_003881 [Tritrichomonas musculus]|uniref:Uncharacterized protein n=1 Tax=Tritrichomonas musculus TaxID=1915356 RepID=A0ABR2JRV2_9EUKA
MFLSLFSFGLPFNLSSCGEDNYNFSIFETLTFSPVNPNEISYGIVKDLLTNCKINPNSLEKCRKVDEISYNNTQLSLLNLIPPIIFSTLAYLVAICIVHVNKLVIIPHDKNETIPVKIYCLKSFQLPEVEILPQFFDTPQAEVLKSWDSIVNDPVEDSFQIPQNKLSKNDFEQFEQETELFDAVNVKSSDISWKPMKSLFSYDNWY